MHSKILYIAGLYWGISTCIFILIAGMMTKTCYYNQSPICQHATVGVDKGSTNTVIGSALDVGKKRSASPGALFITWAFVLSFDDLAAVVSAVYNLHAPRTLILKFCYGVYCPVHCLKVFSET